MEMHDRIFYTERSVVQGFHNLYLEGKYGNTYRNEPIELQGVWFRISFSVVTSSNTWEHIHVEMHRV